MPFLTIRGFGDAGDGTLSTLRITRGLGATAAAPIINVFDVQGARLVGSLVVRVTFSKAVRRLSAAATDDALNPALWTTAGPENVTLEAVLPVPEDLASVDLFYRTALKTGTWTVTADAGMLALDGSLLVDPRAATFDVAVMAASTDVAARDDDRVLRKHLSPALRGPAWTALIKALDNSDQRTWAVARGVRDQRYLATASGEFLAQRAGERGLQLEADVGLSDDAFRALALAVSNRRVTQRAIQDLLEAFYGPGACRAGISSTVEPFELREGDELSLVLGEVRRVTISFARGDAVSIARATAQEVVAVLNRGLRLAGTHAYAEAEPDPTTGILTVRLHADARGLSSAVRIVGGRAQVALGFPELLFSGAAGPFGTWDLTPSPTAGRVRFTLSGTSPYDLSLVQEGDLALVYGEEFSDAVRGSHQIVQVFRAFPAGLLTQWFEVTGSFTQSGVTQAAATSLVFHRPHLATINDNPRRAFASQAPGRGVELTLPTTSPAVARRAGRASYLHGRAVLAVTAADRDAAGLVTATVPAGHGVDPGDLVFMDGVQFGTAPAVTAGAPSAGLGPSFL